MFLNYSEIITAVQDEMGNQAPSDTKLKRIIEQLVLELNSQFDITTTQKSSAQSLYINGETATDIGAIITDIKNVKQVKFTDDSDNEDYPDFIYKEREEFESRARNDREENTFTTYWEDGILYIKVNSVKHSSSATSMTIIYYSIHTFIDSTLTTTSRSVNDESTDKILMPLSFKKLIVQGTLRQAWQASRGVDGAATEIALARNSFISQKRKLGLADVGKKPKTKEKNISIYNPLA